MVLRRLVIAIVLTPVLALGLGAQSASRGGSASIRETAAREWLTYLASDQLQGRATYTEGLGLAAAYIAQHLKDWGVKPAGDNGTYFQTVKVLGVRTTSRSSVTVEVNGQTRTFRDGEGISLARNMGGKQTIVADAVQFAGYGLAVPAAKHDDYAGFDPKGKVVVWLGTQAPEAIENQIGRLLGARSRNAVERGAIATIGPVGAGGFGRGGRGAETQPVEEGRGAAPSGGRGAQPDAAGRGQGRGRGAIDDGDFTTVQRLGQPVPPAISAEDGFFEFLFSGADVKYAELKQKAANREPLPSFALQGVKLTFNVDADYTVVRTRYTRNVVGIVEGADPKLKDTYVVYGAHYDHTGYRETGPAQGQSDDIINNGADDDGSGTVGIMAIARAFALGPKPKRSILFVWHAGEESGLLGSRYNADYPLVPLDRMVAQINMDMIGRNRDDDPKHSNTVYVVGSDRISTELHNINEDANASLPKPLTLDYEYNDPADPQSFYTRSDHYSYAAKGIPIIFYFTGTHPDYHRVSDTADKIIYEKLVRVARLAYETGRMVANLTHPVERDNKGPRVGRTVGGKIKAEG
jgi:hypothetical protein